MDNIEKVKEYLEKLQESTKEVAYSELSGNMGLTRDQKNLIWNYLFPEPLLDYELPSVVQKYLSGIGQIRGLLHPDPGMLSILVRALRTDQYGKFMKHLIIAFTDINKLFPVAGEGTTNTCPICGKTMYRYKTWKEKCKENPEFGEQDRGEYLAYGSTDSDLCLCKNCLVQLNNLNETMLRLDTNYMIPKWKQGKTHRK